MRNTIFCFFLLFCFSCETKIIDNEIIDASSSFLLEFDDVKYYKSNLDFEKFSLDDDLDKTSEISITQGDSILLSRYLSKGVLLSKKQSNNLKDFLLDSNNFKTDGSSCGTYFDLSCFVFRKNNVIIGVVKLGCSFGSIRVIPSNDYELRISDSGLDKIDSILSEIEAK